MVKRYRKNIETSLTEVMRDVDGKKHTRALVSAAAQFYNTLRLEFDMTPQSIRIMMYAIIDNASQKEEVYLKEEGLV